MGGRLLKRKKRTRDLPRLTNCPNCKERFRKGEGGHFIPPSMGERGFFICRLVEELRLDK